MIPEALLVTLRFVCISHLASCAVYLMLHHRGQSSARYGAAFCLGVIAYLIVPSLYPTTLWIILPLFAVAGTQAFWFWMLALSFFREGFRSRPVHWFVLVVKVAVSVAMAWMIARNMSHISPEVEFLYVLPAVSFSGVLVILGIREAVRDYGDDLLEGRRNLRVLYVTAGGGAILFASVFRLGAQGEELRSLHQLSTYVLTLTLCYGFLWTAMTVRADLLEESPATEDVKRGDPTLDEALRRRLVNAFELERMYREEGLTIRRLAARLESTEHKLRRLINAGLGYRNFNDFLNRYRIQEACEILLDPGRRELPIVRIADDLGYRSLGSFNKAFRDLTGQTPTEYRRAETPETSASQKPDDFRNS